MNVRLLSIPLVFYLRVITANQLFDDSNCTWHAEWMNLVVRVHPENDEHGFLAKSAINSNLLLVNTSREELCNAKVRSVRGYAREAARVPHKPIEYIGGVSFLFLSTRELWVPGIWSWWLEDAQQWAMEQFPLEVEQGGWRSVVDIVVHVSRTRTKNMPIDTHIKFPPNFREKIVQTPAICSWGATLPCMRRVLEVGVQNERSQFFVFVSDSSIPVKRFSEIYQDLHHNPRSRIHFSNLSFSPVVKHHQWVVLTRPHALILTTAAWHSRTLNVAACKKRWYAADDEVMTFTALVAHLGEKPTFEQINDGALVLKDPAHPRCKEESMNSIFKSTEVVWQKRLCQNISLHRSDFYFGTGPCVFKKLTVSYIKELHESRAWMLRKVHPQALVRNDTSDPGVHVSKYLADFLGHGDVCDKCYKRLNETQHLQPRPPPNFSAFQELSWRNCISFVWEKIVSALFFVNFQ